MRYWILIVCTILLTGFSQVDSEVMLSDHNHREGSGMVEVEVKTPVLTRIEEFHGHIGPYVVLGYKMGLMARDLLDSPGYFDLTVKVESPLKPPPSCLIDGIQLGSGCTAGKRNLTVVGGLLGKATFRTREGKTVVLSLRTEIPEKVRHWIEEIGVEAAGKRILETPTSQLIEHRDH